MAPVKMQRWSCSGSFLIVVIFLLFVGLGPTAAVAQTEETQSAGAPGSIYVLPYIVVLLSVGLGVFVVVSPTRRRDRPKAVEWKSTTGLAEAVAESGPPVIMVGMRIDQVTKLLGKPKIARKGSEIYRELYQAGKLSEEDAAKQYLTFEHKAGRYEIVVLDKRVVQILKQPAPKPQPGKK
ncbi:MAG: hypothetical protein NZ899_11140 [Thermoguttaceae bacterium]|nr:hypothetical protein [Thermoguttaceae bacterium]